MTNKSGNNQEDAMREIFDTAHKMKTGEIKTDVKYDSVESFIADITKQ